MKKTLYIEMDRDEDRDVNKSLLDWLPINERLCVSHDQLISSKVCVFLSLGLSTAY